MATLGIISAVVITSSLLLLRANDLDLAIATTTQNLRSAQLRSRGSDGDAQWGVFVGNGAITLFRGASFAARNSAYDETTDLASTITPSGLTEINFAKNTGLPISSGVVTLTHAVIGKKQLFINSLGLVDELTSGPTTFTSGRDATLVQSSPTTNFGTATQLEEYPRNNGYNKRASLWFNLSTIPSNAQIINATVQLYETQTYGVSRTVAVHRITQSWNETSVTWNTLSSGFATTPTASTTLVWDGSLSWDQWNVTADVAAMVAGSQPNYGWLIKDNQEDLSEAYWYFSSREGAHPPQLIVDYVVP